MSKWITFYEDVFNGVQDIVIHQDKETATKYFRTHYRNYFQLSSKIKIELPMSYGYPFRKFKGMSLISFNKHYKDLAEQLKEKKDGC